MEGNFDTLASQDPAATPRMSRDTTNERQGSNRSIDQSRTSGLDRKESSLFGRRPSEQSVGAITPSSSRIESQGGAGGLFGSPATRPRTSSLIPSFGFSKSRLASSADLDGASKSPGSFANGARSNSSDVRRDTSELVSASASTLLPVQANGADKSPRVSSSSRPSLSGQLSAGTAPSDAEAKLSSEKPEKKVSLSAYLPYDDEEATEYAERIASTAPKSQIAAILASNADVFYVEALQHFMSRFWFNSLPLDIALRKLLMDLHLPKETQQIDRMMEAFAKRYNECNNGLFASDDQPYILSFSLMMLHTDAFNKNAKNKMTKADYLRNTGASGVPTEILEYLYDNLTFTQFIYIEDEEASGKRRPSEASGMSLPASSMSTSLGSQSGAAANQRLKIDPYFLIAQGRLGELRPDLEDLIPEDTPFSCTGSLPTFDVERLNSAFLHAPSIEIVTTKPAGEEPGAAAASPLDVEEEVVSLKVTKVGVVNRKDDVSDGGKKGASRKWKTSGLLLTGSQLLLFKDVIWINALQSQILDQVGHSLLNNGIPSDEDGADDVVEGGVVITPRITYFRPDGVISLADAVAVKDQSYGKYDHVFRLVAAKGRQYLVQAQSEDDLNDWIHKINFCASFRTSNIKIRGLDLAPRVGPGAALNDADTAERFASLAKRSFSGSERATRRMDADESGRSTPIGDDSGEVSRDGTSRSSMDPVTRPGDSSQPARPRSSASLRLSPASSAIQKRARARRELMLTKIAESEVQLERATSRLSEEIRLARHFAILTPFLKTTRDRIEMSALPLANRIRSLRLDVAKTEARCKILRLDLAAGERVARALLPNTYLSSSAIRAASRLPSGQVGTPQLMEMGRASDSQSQFEDLFGAPGSNGASAQDLTSMPASLSGTINKPASHQRSQMNLNAVSEQPADESPVMAGGRPLPDAEVETTQPGTERKLNKKHSATDEVPQDWDLSQVARPGTNRISLVNLPSPNELEQATGGRFRFGRDTSE
ncbi:Sec7 domain protein [Kalmanozyma brasiliensis GHG001]|uniref:Guanine nucleotide exchange factor n=1 Tax=Kalmanozyma brasiliensis (strain GHG001) TaxID=1365824 RepID=V5GV44_KALBG|nr:Sec7 domain protein [Kalmanozyma brasiliensis GHG001]EST09777.1 Sec7 domain protein [Kalmanozyma brasiliensis GHG001]